MWVLHVARTSRKTEQASAVRETRQKKISSQIVQIPSPVILFLSLSLSLKINGCDLFEILPLKG